ncbi:glycosyltransferase family 2 protein [bacterium]|nr:glycosyltransferase family 2 protein [bacterium]
MPKLSIILPTYNRGKFISTALSSIIKQTFTDWELIIVDDGSTDDTKEQIDALMLNNRGKLTYIYQDNGGAYAARKTGLDHASGELITFFDSDDLWMHNHLDDVVALLDKHPQLDWLTVRDCQVKTTENLELANQEMSPIPAQITSLESTWKGDLQMIESPALVETLLNTGHNCGLPLSVMRRHVIEKTSMDATHRNGEDRMFLIRAVKHGIKIAILHRIHYIFLQHNGNSSAAALTITREKKLAIYKAISAGYRKLDDDLHLSKKERRALHKRVAKDLFWCVGYEINWEAGHHSEAFEAFSEALALSPLNLAMRKTYFLCLFKAKLRLSKSKLMA